MITIPNLVTISGMAATCIYVAAYLTGHVYVAIAAACWTMLSDFFDGKLARALKQESAFGATLDPVNDRLFLAAALGNIAYLYGFEAMITVWTVVIVAAEAFIFAAYAMMRSLTRVIIKVGFVGKARQVGHLALISIAIADGYFHIGDHVFVPDLPMIFQLMAALSLTALFFYLGRAFTLWHGVRK